MSQSQVRLDVPKHTVESAPESIQETLRVREKQLGLLPNLYGYFANAPGLLNAYLAADEAFRNESTFSPTEQEVVLLTISRANGCTYCVSVHSWLADNLSKVPTEITDAIREWRPIPDEKLEALSRFTEHMWETRGLPDPARMEAFRQAGYQDRQVLDIIHAIGLKTLSNYTNHLTHTEVDAAFGDRAWSG